MTTVAALPTRRAAEIAKYDTAYCNDAYAMGSIRYHASRDMLASVFKQGRKKLVSSYLDIGCGRGEMLDAARKIGFDDVLGTEAVRQLTKRDDVVHMLAHDLAEIRSQRYHVVSSFDVLEHLIPGDDEILIYEAGRIARDFVILTANNLPSVDWRTGNNLHINLRPYDEWLRLIAASLGPSWEVKQIPDKSPSAMFVAKRV